MAVDWSQRKKNMIIVKYEDLKTDTGKELKRIFDFHQIPYIQQQLDLAVENGFNKFQRQHKAKLEYYTKPQKKYVRSIVSATSNMIGNQIDMSDYYEP